MISQLVLSWLMLPRVTRARVMVGVCDDGVDHDQSREQCQVTGQQRSTLRYNIMTGELLN